MKRKVVTSLLAILFISIVSVYSIFILSQRPAARAEKEAAALAKAEVGMQKVADFYWYNGTEDTYFTVGGYDEEGTYQYVIIKQKGGTMWTFSAQEVITEEEAISILLSKVSPNKILEPRMAIKDDQPFWEVAYRAEDGTLSYLVLNAKTGEVLSEQTGI